MKGFNSKERSKIGEAGQLFVNAQQFKLNHDSSGWSGQGSSNYGHWNKYERSETSPMEMLEVRENYLNKTKDGKNDTDNEGKEGDKPGLVFHRPWQSWVGRLKELV